MIWIVIKPKSEGKSKLGCIVNAPTKKEACRMVGISPDNAENAMFTEAEISAIAVTKEGYVSGTM